MDSKIAIVTGGSRGLGRNSVQALAARGVDVILTYQRDQAAAEAVVAQARAQGVRAAALRLDVALSATFPAFAGQVREVLAGWGRERFDFLVNNAGVGLHAPFADTT
ncbi:MAG TPA: SDR family NAD(P)-dependent oxidoreductase, partial [Ramlibacter sp.]|nr:SDR family NAD(P)-dependent oxidoreductase [Ramlibacter sp.]